MPRKLFTSYKVSISQGAKEKARIDCYHEKKLVGRVYFVSKKPKQPYIIHNALWLFYPLSYFDRMIALIQTESPLFLEIWGTTAPYCRITTSQEPVGEEEGLV